MKKHFKKGMGFQLLNILTAADPSVLSSNAFDSEDISWPLDFTQDAKNSRMIRYLSADGNGSIFFFFSRE